MRLIQTIPQIVEEARSLTYAVRNLIPEASMGLVYGASSSYKTFLMLDYLLHRTYGMPWCGLATKKAVGCFVSAEGSSGVWKRIKAWHDAKGMNYLDCPLRIVPRALALPNELHLLRADFDEFKRQTGESFGDLAIDTFSQTFSGNENQADNVADYFNRIRREITQPHRCVTSIMHHTGHNEENPRGSYAFQANVDFRLKIERGKGERMSTLTVEKQKDDLELPPLAFHLNRLQVGIDDEGEPITSLVANYVTDPAKFEAAISETPGGMKKIMLDIADLRLTVDQAKRRFCAQHDGNEQASSRAWSRTKKSLTEYGLIAVEGGKLVRCSAAQSET